MIFSIVIPYYNVKISYLKQCLQSIVEQKDDSCEVIIIDDGSLISPIATIEQFSVLKIKYYRQENQGVSVARNKGIELAMGEYIMFLDPDDKLERNALKKYKRVLEKYPEIELVVTQNGNIRGGREINSEGKEEIEILDSRRLLLSTLNHKEEYIQFASGSPWAKLFKKSFLDVYKLMFVEGLKKSQDRIFMLYCYKKVDKVAFLKDSTYLYREDNSESVCNKFNPNIDIILDNALKEAKNFIELYYPNDEEVYKAYLEMELSFLFIVLKLKFLNKNAPNINLLQQVKCLDKYLKEREIYKKIKMIDYNQYPIKRKVILNFIRTHQITLLLCMKIFIK